MYDFFFTSQSNNQRLSALEKPVLLQVNGALMRTLPKIPVILEAVFLRRTEMFKIVVRLGIQVRP